jgi:hypothetical protein
MIKGIKLFRERFRAYEGAFVMIGGAACDEWFSMIDDSFRGTKDLDIVLIVEVLDPAFVEALHAFREEGGYQIEERIDGTQKLFRFVDPTNAEFPAMLEFFSRKPDLIDLGAGQTIVPIPSDEDYHSLSAILMDEAYYSLIREHHFVQDGLPIANATALIPLKARAWADLLKRQQDGEQGLSKKIRKHRNDVFHLAATLPGQSGPELPSTILDDLRTFLEAFTEDSKEWQGIRDSLKDTMARGISIAGLRSAIHRYYRL